MLDTLIGYKIDADMEMSRRAAGKSNSGFISSASRIGSALILLSGGRYLEGMRTHGVSKSFIYESVLVVCKEMIHCNAFSFDYSIGESTIKTRAQGKALLAFSRTAVGLSTVLVNMQ